MSPHRTSCLLILLVISLCASGQSETYKVIAPQYELEHVKLNNKEDIGQYNNITEDKEGYLWITGTKGLHVFDGHTITSYFNGISPYRITADPASNYFARISSDEKGNFWLSDDTKRFYKFNPVSRALIDSFYFDADMDSRYVQHQVQGETLFFTNRTNPTNRLELFMMTGKQSPKKIFEADMKLTNGFNYYLSANSHWFFIENEITRVSIDGKQMTKYSYPGNNASAFHVYATERSVYFIGAREDLLYYWNETTDKIELLAHLPPMITGKIQGIYVEKDKVYVASNLNLFIIDLSNNTIQDLSEQFVELVRKEAPGSLSEQLIKIFSQRDGTILLGTISNIYRLKKKVPPASQFRQQVDFIREGSIAKLLSFRAITEDEHQTIYASYYTGISKKQKGSSVFSPIPVMQYMKGELVSTYSLQYWKNNLLWNNIMINLVTGKHQYLSDSLFSGHCTQFLQQDRLWLFKWGTSTLHCYDLAKNLLTSYPLDFVQNGGINDMNDIIADASGQNLWISSHDLGLLLLTKKGQLLKRYQHEDLGISDDYITDLERLGDDLWFGCTDGLGVLHTKTGKVSVYKNPVIENGLLKNRAVFSIQTDSVGNFYLGSSYGLLYFDIHDLSFYNLPEGHPLSNVEFNRASVLRASDNRYYFGTTDGLFSFTPGELEFTRLSNSIRPVKLFGISIFNSRSNQYRYISENIDSLDKLVLFPSDNNIQFSFSIPEFYHDVYYSYRIKEQGDNWTAYSPDNKYVLSGLQPGNYTLEVKASTSLTDNNASYYKLTIVMKQSWYKRPWVIALFAAVMTFLLIIYLRSRFNQKLKRQKDLADLRTKISSDLHDDVGTILSGLAMQSQMLTFSAREEQKESLNEISNMSREAMEHMRDTVWAMDSRKDKYENLIDRMRAFAEKNLALKNITHEFIINDIDTKKFIDPEKRQAIYLIFKEAITNIIKHSDGKHVTIRFGYEKNNLHLSIHDNGNGKKQTQSDGLGLSNMKMRAEKIGANLHIVQDDGFTVLLTVK